MFINISAPPILPETDLTSMAISYYSSIDGSLQKSRNTRIGNSDYRKTSIPLINQIKKEKEELLVSESEALIPCIKSSSFAKHPILSKRGEPKYIVGYTGYTGRRFDRDSGRVRIEYR